MPLLADAYAEAHLDLDTMDRDIERARVKLISAFESLERAAVIQLELDTAQAQAELRAFQRTLQDETVNIKVDVDRASVALIEEELADRDGRITITVSTDGAAQAEFELAALRTVIEGIDATSIDIDIDDGEIRSAMTLLANLQAMIAATGAGAVEIEVDQGQLIAAIAELEALIQRIEAEEATVDIKVDVDGITRAIAELEALRAKAQDIDNDEIRLRIDVDGLAEALAKLGSLDSGTAGLDNTVRIDVDIADAASIEATLAGLAAEVEALQVLTAAPIKIDIDIEDLELALAQIAGVEAALAAVAADDLNLDIDINVRGVTLALGEIAKLRAAVETLDGKDVNFRIRPLETAGVIADLIEIREYVGFIENFSELQIDIKTEGFPEALSELESLDALITSLERRTVRLNIALGNLPETITKLADLEAQADLLDGKNIKLDTSLVGSETVAAQMSQLLVSVEALDRRDITWQVDVDGAVEAVTEVIGLRGELEILDNTTIDPKLKLDGIAGFSAKVAEAIALLKSIPNRVSTTISARVSGLSRITSLSRLFTGRGGRGGIFSGLARAASDALRTVTQALSGISSVFTGTLTSVLGSASDAIGKFTTNVGEGAVGQIIGSFKQLGTSIKDLGDSIPLLDTITSGIGNLFGSISQAVGPLIKFNVFAALATSILTLIAYLVPLASGLVAAGAGLIAFGAAAGAAAAGVTVLAVLLEKDIIEDFKKGFEGLKLAVESELQPVIGFIQNDFTPKLFGVLGQAVNNVAPFVKDALVPVSDAVLNLVQTIGQVAGPALRPLSEGLASFINIFDKFLGASKDLAVEGIGSLFNALNALLELLGQVGVAFAPILNQMLDGLASLSIKSISPFLQIVESFGRAVEPLGGSLSRILTPLGELAVTFGEIVAQAAPVLDVFYDLATIVFPPLNFDLMREVANSIFPSILDFARRARPAVESIKEGFSAFFDRLFTPENVANIQGLFEGVLVAIDAVLDALDSPGTTDFFGFLIEGASQFIAILLRLGGAFTDFIALNIAGLDGILEVIAGVADGIGTILNAIDFLPGIEDRAGDDIKEWARNTQDALDDTRDTVFNFGNALSEGASAIGGFSGELGRAGDGLNILDEELLSNWQTLQGIGAVLPPVVGELKAVGPSAADAAERMAQLQDAFKNTLSAIEGLTSEAGTPQLANFIDNENVSVTNALDDFQASVTLRLDNLKRINFVEALGFENIAAELATLDPEIFTQVFDQIFANGEEGAALVETQLEAIGARMELAAAGLNEGLNEKLIEGGDEAAINMRNFFQGLQDAIREGQETFLGEEINYDDAAVAGVVAGDGTVPPDVAEAIQGTAAASAEEMTAAFNESFADIDLTETLSNPLNDAVTGLSQVARDMQQVGQSIGENIIKGLQFSLLVGGLSLDGILSAVVLSAGANTIAITRIVGLAIGTSLAAGLAQGLEIAGNIVRGSFAVIVASLAEVGGALAPTIGLAIGTLLGASIAEGVMSVASLLGEAISASLTLAVGTAAISTLQSGALLGTGLVQGVNQGIAAAVGALTAVVAAAVSQAILGALGIVLTLGGVVGRAFIGSVAQGILAAGAFISAAIAAALAPGSALGIALAYGIAIGNALVQGIVAGITAIAGLIAAVTVAAVAQAAAAGTAIGLTTFRIAGIASATAFAAGVTAALGALAASVAAFARAVGQRVGLAFTAGLQAGINSGMAGISVPLGGLSAVGPRLRGIGLSAGQNYGAGLAAGIRAGLSSAVAAARAAANAIAAATRQALAISSPSKVMQTIGEQVAEGLAVGIEKGVPMIEDATGRMAKVIEEYEFLRTFGTPVYVNGVRRYNTEESSDFLFRWNSLTDPNRGKPGYTQAEDGTFVPNSFYDRTAGPTINVEVVDQTGDPNRTGAIIGRRIERKLRP